MKASTRNYKSDLWVVIKPAEDVRGVWVSHCLTLDVISQGSTVHDAFKHLMSAVFMAVADDLLAGRDPAARGRKTPKEDWEEQALIVRQGERVRLDESEKSANVALATNIGLNLTIHIEKSTSTRRSSRALRSDADATMPMAIVEETPPAWMIPVASARAVHR